MKEDKSEVIATSNDLCNPNQTILIVGEDDHVLIHSEKKVSLYSISSTKFLKNLLETEVIESIWSQDPEHDHFYALSSLNNEFKVLKVQIPSGNVLKKLKWNKSIEVPEKTLKILPEFKVQEDDKVVLDRVYFLSKQKNQVQLTCQLNENAKKMNFGQVDLDPKGIPMADFNADIVVKVCQAITGQVGSKIHLYTALGVTSWSQKLDKKTTRHILEMCSKRCEFCHWRSIRKD